MKAMFKQVQLNNNNWLPCLGLGTYLVSSKEHIYKILSAAYSSGYRLVDTARMYGNEDDIGWALKKLKEARGVERSEFWVTSKVMPRDTCYKGAYKSVRKSLSELQTDYLDLLLIHWPTSSGAQRIDCWKGMQELYSKGLVRNIGVSNFTASQLRELLDHAGTQTAPCVNQIEVHPLYQDEETVEFCKREGIVIESYSPLAQKDPALMRNRVLKEIGKKHKKSVAQIILRWNYQRGFIALPRSNDVRHVEENADIFGFQLSADDVREIERLNEMKKVEWDPHTIQ
eukprot:TRINITY_DN2572_c0_g3_i1.p1 TRINITY_DN2572_c0_g3~~TRINITY_DN2572_c0_g3_i1.p1  ORF type:complete len:285 (-),score=48.01 TRINITY_DN2572_c0_g3_i1:25-879(-)